MKAEGEWGGRRLAFPNGLRHVVPENSMTGNAQAAERAGRRLLLLALCGGVLVVAVFLACLLLVAADTPLAPPQPDTLMYMQYARAAAEGHPYRFTADQGPSTGSTSHLYPFLLAALYRAGARGDALFAAGFALNAVFYLLVIWLAWLLARRLAPGAEAVALGLVLLSGPLACGALGGSDMGLFMVLALATLTALVYARPRTAAACIALAVWARPEGFIMASVLLAAGLWRMLRRRGHPTLAAIGLWACAHMAAVLWLNHALTGRLVFLSLAGKGYRALHPFPWFLAHVMRDYASVALGLLLGLGRDGRAYYMVPVVGGVAGLVGLGRWWCPAEGRFAAAWWWISVLGAFGLVAMGGWQGYLHDRHLAWVLAPWIVCVAAGVGAPPVPPAVRRLLVALLVGYQAVTFPYFVRSFARMAERTAGQAAFARRVAARLPAGARVGVLNYPGLAYVMPGRTLVHLGGYVSPPFVTDGDFVTNIETLKHRPETRFEAWLLAGYEGRHREGGAGIVGRIAVAGVSGGGLVHAGRAVRTAGPRGAGGGVGAAAGGLAGRGLAARRGGARIRGLRF